MANETVAENTEVDAVSGKELIDFSIILPEVTDEKIKFLCEDDAGHVATLTIRLQGYDEVARKYVEDPAVMEAALKSMSEIGIEDTASAAIAFGHTFAGYLDEENSRVSLRPVQKFVRFSRIETIDKNVLKREVIDKGVLVETLPLSEFFGTRFNFGFEANIKGDVKNFRISQFIKPSDDDEIADVYVSTKYATRDVASFEEVLKNSALPEEAQANVRQKIDMLKAKAREKKIEEMKDVLGVDIEEMLNTGESISMKIQLREIPGADANFLVAEIVD